MGVTLFVPKKAYQDGVINVEAEWEFSGKWIAPDIRMEIYVDGQLVEDGQFNGQAAGTLETQVHAPAAPNTSVRVTAKAIGTGVVDHGLLGEDSRSVALVPSGTNIPDDEEENSGGEDDKFDWAKYKTPIIAVGLIGGIIAVGMVMTRHDRYNH